MTQFQPTHRMHFAHRSRSSRRGSTLVVVMVIVLALTVIIAGLMTTMTTDKRINRSVALLDEARNAAEGATEVAAAEFSRRVKAFNTSANPLADFVIPDSVKADLAIGNVVPDSVAYKAGELSAYPDARTLLASNDPFYQYDPNKTMSVRLQMAYIYGKASSKDPLTNRVIDRYTSTLLQVRTQSWLDYGVFGNLDLEWHAGPKMNVTGPVHSNRNLYLVGGADLLFFSNVTTTGKIFRGFKDGTSTIPGGAVKFPNRESPTESQLVSMSTSQDSAASSFEDLARSRWDGYVQDYHFDVQAFSPPGLPLYVEDNYKTAANETENHAYALIEPQLAKVLADDPLAGIYAGHKGEAIENLKLSAYAGLVIRIKPPAEAAAAAGLTLTEYWQRTRLDNDDPLFEPGFELVTFTPQTPSRPVNRDNLPSRGPDGRPLETIITIDADHMSVAQRNRLFAAIKLVQFQQTGTGTDGNRTLLGTAFAAENDTDTSLTTPTTTTWYPIYDRRQGFNRGSTTNFGFRGAHHTLHVDMGKLNTFLNATDSEWTDLLDHSKKVYNPNSRYTGVVYVQFPLDPYEDDILARRTVDKIRPAVRPDQTTVGYALMVRNATRLPQLPSNPSLRSDGLVLGTNGAAYLLGHFNADGNSTTGSTSNPDPGHDEIPALVAADSLTILSMNFANNASYFENSAKTERPTASTFTEVSGAIFAGVIPTRLTTSLVGQNNQRMGGVHNYLRLLENWGSSSYRYRGSFALLWECEVHKQPYYEDKHPYWYSPPTRNVGYHIYFAEGLQTVWPPPSKTVRRLTVDDINEADWNAAIPVPAI